MNKYAIPMKFVYESQMFVEAESELEALAMLKENQDKWLPSIWRGSESTPVNGKAKWANIQVFAPVLVLQKAEASTVKPSRRRAK